MAQGKLTGVTGAPAGLAAFLSRAAARGFRWGAHDCMLFAADWALARTGQDPATAWRGSYADEAGALAILKAEGGAAAIMAQGLEPLGWRRVDAGLPGDIVLAAADRHPHIAGIAVGGGRVVLLTRRGVLVWPVPVVAAWRHDLAFSPGAGRGKR